MTRCYIVVLPLPKHPRLLPCVKLVSFIAAPAQMLDKPFEMIICFAPCKNGALIIVIRKDIEKFLVADTRLYTLLCRSVGQ